MDYPVGFPSRTPSALEPEPLERIRKLEELVGNPDSQRYESMKHPKNSDTRAQQACSSASSPRNERLDDDVAWLESIYNGHNLSVNIITLQH